MTSFEFEGRAIPVHDGDTIATALYRAGVRIFSRSFKFHRPRGLLCGTGDCPNCSMVVDGEPAVRTCVTPARAGARVTRHAGWPSADRDLFGALWWARALLPVGFYYKSMIKPKGFWPVAEGPIRKLAGLGPVPLGSEPVIRERRYHHPDLCVVGLGAAGLGAAAAAAERGERVVGCDEGTIAESAVDPAERRRLFALAERARAAGAVLIERGTAVGLYEGPLVPVASDDFLHLVLPGRVLVATGAVERTAVFEGNDLPGVWLARGAAAFAARGLSIGRRAVVVIEHESGLGALAAIAAGGTEIVSVVVTEALADRVPATFAKVTGRVIAAEGTRSVRAVRLEGAGGSTRIGCDALVLALGFAPRDSLVRQGIAAGVAVETAGDVATPAEPSRGGASGFVCLCEDVTAEDFELAWEEGYQHTELLKRYSTATMGPCQGAMCQGHLRACAAAHGAPVPAAAATTARPPARPVRLEDVAAGARHPLEWRTALHDRHLASGATMEWTGVWKRPERYGDVLAEYRAVREAVSVMDVSTLGKFRIGGPDATAFLERLYPCHVATIRPERTRYALVLNEAGYVFDDGLIGSLGRNGWYLTFTSGGADVAESWLRDWAETWRMRVWIANQTMTLSAINVAGPKARELLSRLTGEPVDGKAIPYSGIREVTVAGVPCLVLRVGFVGELSFELHHPRLESERLWAALLEAGRDLGIRPHGLEALRLLRLEKGHIIVGQDTDFDSTPAKLGLDWAARLEKPDFVGRTALVRLGAIPAHKALRAFRFEGGGAPVDGAQLLVDGQRVGALTSARFSPVLGHGIGLGWVDRVGDDFPAEVVAVDGTGRYRGRLHHGPFYDPEGVRLRG